MGSSALQLLLLEVLALALLVFGLFRLRRRVGLTPLYVSLGVFQPLQAILSSSVYVDLWPGIPVSPGTMMFTASLLAVLLVYIREDALEVRKAVYGIIVANLVMTLVMWGTSVQLATPGTDNLAGLPMAMFSQGARVTAVGTAVLLADVVLLILCYGGARRLFPRHPLLRVWFTLTGVLLFDALAFITGAFAGHPQFPALLLASVVSKTLIAVLYSALLVAYLRFVEPVHTSDIAGDHPLRDIFYSLTYRDRFELQRQKAERLNEERRQVFERITDAFVALDRDWAYTYVNAKAAQMLGRRPEELVGRQVWEAFPEGVALGMDQRYRQVMQEQKPAFLEVWYPPLGRWLEQRIYPSPEGLTIYFHDITDRVERQDELLRRATRDELTGLANRRAMRETLEALLAARSGERRHVGAIALNIDRLHHVNDTLGYAAGDEVLRQAAQRLDALSRDHGCAVGRIGGDEFLLAAGPTDAPEAFEQLARSAAMELGQRYLLDGKTVYLTCSAGLSWSPDGGEDASLLLGQADLALNLAKERGRSQVVTHSAERTVEVAERVALIAAMREGLQHGAFALHYQPLVSAGGGFRGVEALLRWNDPARGAVSPARFIPVAEDAGMIVELGHWALRTALHQVGRLRHEGQPVPLSVNVSVVQFQRPDFCAEVEQALRDSATPPWLLTLEITESVFMDDAQTATRVLQRLKAMGVRIALDDFGTGWSSLAHLRTLPLDAIKIDRSFVRDVPGDGFSATLCRAVVALARPLRFEVVAEGVETEAQARFLVDVGCEVLQGFLYSRPLPADALASLLAAPQWRQDGRNDGAPPGQLQAH